MHLIYKATNTQNGNFYIGITERSVETRRREHFRHARYCVNKGRFYRAIRKYGEDAFEWETLHIGLTWEEAKQKEVELIAILKPPYNSTLGGDGTAGHRITPEGRARMSAAAKGRKPMLGKTWSQERRLAMSEKKKGCPAPPVSDLMSKTRLRNCIAGARTRSRALWCLNTGDIFPNSSSAAAHFGISRSAVFRVAQGQRLFVNNLKFAFA